MSQSPRDPQRKLRQPLEWPKESLPEDAREAEAAPGAETSPGAPPAAPVPPEVTPAPPIPPPPDSAPFVVMPAPGLAVPAARTVEPAPAIPPAPPPVIADDSADQDDDDSKLDAEPDQPLTIGERLRRLSPTFVTLTVGSIGSMVFLALAMTSHTTPVAVLMSAGVVTSLVFALDAVMCTAASYAAGGRQESGRALVFALVGGVSAMVCASATAGTVILILVLTR